MTGRARAIPPVMKQILLLFALGMAPGLSHAYAQSSPLNTVTFSAGYARDVNAFCCQTDTAVSYGGTFGRRVFRYLEAEAGVSVAPNIAQEIRGATYDIKPDDRLIRVPFGVRGILPLWHNRVELSAGGGGLFEKYSVSNPNPGFGLLSQTGWGGYFAGGAAVALDHKRHFWLGSTPHWYLANTSNNGRSRWFVASGEVSFRF